MIRYFLIDHASGYVMADTADLDGPERAETPAEACRRLDARSGEHGRSYLEHGPGHRPGTGLASAYHVYRAPPVSAAYPLIVDGTDLDLAAAVEKWCVKVAVVTCHHGGESAR